MSDTETKSRRVPMDIARAQVPEGRVHVIVDRCKQCDFCITYCPTEVLVYSPETNARGYHFPIVADGKESSCIRCQFCDLICPELAIFTTDAAAEPVAGGASDAG